MIIQKPNYTWAWALTPRAVTSHLILHHAAAKSLTPEAIHAYHLSKGWAGIAYHYYIRKDGTVYEGRPEKMCGGHTTNWNHCAIGVCFEGNFQEEEMPEAQRKAGQALVADIVSRYPAIKIGRHSEFGQTACPGINFPFAEICAGKDPEPANGSVEAAEQWKIDFFEKAFKDGFITDASWLNKLDEPAPVWLVLALASRIKQ